MARTDVCKRKQMTPLRAAITAMAFRGLRVGALEGLRVEGARFWTASKGKRWTGELPPRVRHALAPLGPRPFRGVKKDTISAAFKRTTKRLAASGAIAHAYSVHDLRHFYATAQHKKGKSLAEICKLLNHADPKVTMGYLHDLGLM